MGGQGQSVAERAGPNEVLVIIPAYNEEASIGSTVASLIENAGCDYVVVNDGSTDATRDILDRQGFEHIDLPVNLGIGGAMQTGYKYAAEKGYRFAFQLDADGQHDPADFGRLLEAIRRGDCDLVVGSRFGTDNGYRGTFIRRAGICYFQLLVRLLTGRKITDPTSGFRVVNRKVIEEFAGGYPIDYPEVEVLVSLARRKYRLKEVGVAMRPRQGGVSSIGRSDSIYYLAKVTVFSLIRRFF